LLTPVGFWSYARQDDNHSDGQLSELRAIVGKAINLRRGEEVRLFQDTEAIPIGADWEATIESTIAQTTFFIPLVTPRFLKSEHCRDEFKAFRRRMAAMGRHDLIFPVHYVDVDRIAPTETAFGDELLALRRQQWLDFRPLQYEDIKSPKVRRWADTLAASVLSAMTGAPSPQPAPARTPPPASSPRQEPAKTYAAASNERVIGSTAASLPAAAVRAIRRFSLLGLEFELNLNDIVVKTLLTSSAWFLLVLAPNNFDLNRVNFNYDFVYQYLGILLLSSFVRITTFLSYILFLFLFYVLFRIFSMQFLLPDSGSMNQLLHGNTAMF